MVDTSTIGGMKTAERGVAWSRNLSEDGVGNRANEGTTNPNDSNAATPPRRRNSGDGVVQGQVKIRMWRPQRRRFAAAFSILRVMYHC